MFFLRGTSIIEALVLIFVFSVAILSFYSVFTVGVRYILSSKNKILAVSLANQEMEKLRNLPYDKLGLKNGTPLGDIDQEKNVAVGDKTFLVRTFILFDDEAISYALDGDMTIIKSFVTKDDNPDQRF